VIRTQRKTRQPRLPFLLPAGGTGQAAARSGSGIIAW